MLRYKWKATVFIFLFFLHSVIVSCTEKKQKNYENNSLDENPMVQENPKDIFNDTAVIMKYNDTEFIKLAGKPQTETIFPVKKASRPQWILFNYFPQNSDVLIKELTWSIDSVNNITVWYSLSQNLWLPVTLDIWVKGTEF